MGMRIDLRPLSAGLLVLSSLASATSHAQSVLATITNDPSLGTGGPYPIGDVDLDGITDLIVTDHDDDTNGAEAGRAWVLSGADGSVLHDLRGQQPDDWYGWSAAGGSDLDSDGVPDFLISAVQGGGTSQGVGYVEIRSGSDGSLIRTEYGLTPGGKFGWSLAIPGDVDGDGVSDLVFGAMDTWVYVRSGSTGIGLNSFQNVLGGVYGVSLAGIGDIDGDGLPELAIGCIQGSGSPGFVEIRGVINGVLHARHHGSANGDEFGLFVDGGYDIDGDGVPDYVAAARRYWTSTQWYMKAYSGADQSLIWTVDSADPGVEYSGAPLLHPDADGDGRADVLARGVGVLLAMFSGASGVTAYQSQSIPFLSAGLFGDYDADGVEDVVAGYGPSVTVISVGSQEALGSFCGASYENEASLEMVSADDAMVTLQVDVGHPGVVGVLLFGEASAQAPFGSSTLCIGGAVRRVPPRAMTGANGVMTFQLDRDASSGAFELFPLGGERFIQCLYRRGSAFSVYRLSSALRVRFQ